MGSLADCLKQVSPDVKPELRQLARQYAKTMPAADAEKRAAAELLEAALDDLETVRETLTDRGFDVGVKEAPAPQALLSQVADRIAQAIQQVGPAEDAEVALPPTTLQQVGDLPVWREKTAQWMRKNGYTEKETSRQLAAMDGQMAIISALGPAELQLFPVGAGDNPGRGKGPFRTNADPIYKITFDASAMCVKRLEAAATAAEVQKRIGRALTTSERMALVALFKASGKTAPCLYCYVEAPRAKMAEFSQKGVDMALGKRAIPRNWSKSMQDLAAQAKEEAQRVGLTEIDTNLFIDPDYLNANLEKAEALKSQAPVVYDFVSKAGLAAKANLPKRYEQYVAQILELKQDLLDELNNYAGLRFFSSSDFQAEHVVDLMQAFHDMDLRKIRAHSYTKVPTFVEIFGSTGMKIQTSIFAREKADGSFAPDTFQGMEWEKAQAFRAKYPNVGSVLVATSDRMVKWALEQDWIDYIIPFHYSGLEKKFYGELGWQDFTSTQSEKSMVKGEKANKVRMHDVGVREGVSNEAATRKYLELALDRKLYPVFPAFLFKDFEPSGDQKKRSGEARAARARWAKMVESGQIDWEQINPGYFKLKKDYARTDSPFVPVQANFDLEAADRTIKSFLAGAEPRAQVDAGIADQLVQQIQAAGGRDIGVDMLRADRERTFLQIQPGAPRAQISFNTASGRPLVELFETANESSFLHESGHLFLEMMRALALEPNAAAPIVQLWADAKAALNLADDTLTRDAHEAWASNLELYFMQGKAPSLGLRGVFAKYASWLKEIYKQFIAGGHSPNEKLTPIFDRLFATEEEIKEAEAFYSAQKPFFTLADQMLEEERARYEKLRERAQESQQDARVRRLAKAAIKAQGGMDEIKAQAREEVEALPVFRALADAAKSGIAYDLLTDAVGADMRKTLAKARPGLVRTEGSLDPHVLAATHGFANPGEMVQAMLAAGTKADAVKATVDARVEAERRKIARGLAEQGMLPADEAYHNEDRLNLLIAEFQMLQDAQRARQNMAKGRSQRITASAAREVAKKVLRSYNLKDASSPLKFARAERKAAQAARAAHEKGDIAKAAEFKRQEMLNHALFLESMRAREDIAAIGRTIKRASKTKAMGETEREILRGLGVQYNLLPFQKQTGEAAWIAYLNSFQEERPNLTAWLESMKDFGPDIDPFILNNTGYLTAQALTYGQFESLRDAVRTVATIDRQQRTILAEGKRIEIEQVVKELAEAVAGRKDRSPKRSTKKGVKRSLSRLHAVHAKMETMLLDMDGWSPGAWWGYFFKPIADAENARTERLKPLAAQLKEIFKPVRKGLGDKVFIPAINDTLTRHEILSVALNLGNEGNYLRLKEGYGWTDEQVEAIKDLLDEKDWKFVTDLAGLIGSFKEESFALQKEITGREPSAVETRPVDTKFGRFEGWYYPARYDADLSYKQFERDQKALNDELFGGRNFATAQTRHGHLKERAQTGGGQAILLDLSAASDHVYNTVHDLTHRRAVLDVAKLMRNKEVQKLVERTLGLDAYREFMPWLVSVSREMQEPQNQLHRWARWARKGTTIMQMGLKFTTMFTQPLGFLQTVDVLGPAYAMLGVRHFASVDFWNRAKEVMDKSSFMANRMQGFDREVRDSLAGLGGLDGVKKDIEAFAFKGIGVMQMGVDLPTWYGAYLKGLSENEGSEAKAIDYADMIVRQSQGSGSLKDLSRIQRGGEFQRLATMFYSYFNTLYNLTYRRAGMTRGYKDIPALASSALLLWFLPAVLGELVAGRGPDDDDELPAWVAQKIGLYPFQMIVGVRDVANGLGGAFGYQLTPAESAPASIIKWAKAVDKAIGEEDPEKLVKPTAEMVGFLFHLPLKQPIITLGNVWDYATGKDPDFEVRDLFFTKPKDRR